MVLVHRKNWDNERQSLTTRSSTMLTKAQGIQWVAQQNDLVILQRACVAEGISHAGTIAELQARLTQKLQQLQNDNDPSQIDPNSLPALPTGRWEDFIAKIRALPWGKISLVVAIAALLTVLVLLGSYAYNNRDRFRPKPQSITVVSIDGPRLTRVGQEAEYIVQTKGGDPYDYDWNWNGGQDSGSKTIKVAFQESGTANITVIAWDKNGDSATKAISVTVRSPLTTPLPIVPPLASPTLLVPPASPTPLPVTPPPLPSPPPSDASKAGAPGPILQVSTCTAKVQSETPFDVNSNMDTGDQAGWTVTYAEDNTGASFLAIIELGLNLEFESTRIRGKYWLLDGDQTGVVCFALQKAAIIGCPYLLYVGKQTPPPGWNTAYPRGWKMFTNQPFKEPKAVDNGVWSDSVNRSIKENRPIGDAEGVIYGQFWDGSDAKHVIHTIVAPGYSLTFTGYQGTSWKVIGGDPQARFNQMTREVEERDDHPDVKKVYCGPKIPQGWDKALPSGWTCKVR